MTRNRLLLLAGILLASVGLDQWSKMWADASLGTPLHPLPMAIAKEDDGKLLGDVLKARYNLDDTAIDELFARGAFGVLRLHTEPRPKPGDPAILTVGGKPRLRDMWAFHHRTFDMPPRRMPPSAQTQPALEKSGQNTVADYLAIALPYLGDEARAEVMDKYLFNVFTSLLQPAQRVSEGEIYLVLDRGVDVIGGFLGFKYAENPGAAWGFLSGQSETFRKIFFLLVSLIAIGVISMLYYRLQPDQTIAAAAFATILSGAIGNFIDRLRFNYVIDFVDMYVGESHWPTYNVADIAITAGVILLLLELAIKRNRSFLSTSGKKTA